MRPIRKSLADLDTFSRAFSPEESARFYSNAEASGFPILTNTLYVNKVMQGLMPPINPDKWADWEKKHNKSAAETFKKNGFNPDEVAAEYKRLTREGKAGRADEVKATPKK